MSRDSAVVVAMLANVLAGAAAVGSFGRPGGLRWSLVAVVVSAVSAFLLGSVAISVAGAAMIVIMAALFRIDEEAHRILTFALLIGGAFMMIIAAAYISAGDA